MKQPKWVSRLGKKACAVTIGFDEFTVVGYDNGKYIGRVDGMFGPFYKMFPEDKVHFDRIRQREKEYRERWSKMWNLGFALTSSEPPKKVE